MNILIISNSLSVTPITIPMSIPLPGTVVGISGFTGRGGGEPFSSPVGVFGGWGFSCIISFSVSVKESKNQNI